MNETWNYGVEDKSMRKSTADNTTVDWRASPGRMSQRSAGTTIDSQQQNGTDAANRVSSISLLLFTSVVNPKCYCLLLVQG